MNNDKEIREILESEEVPEELSPENVKKMLDEKTSAKKRKKISVAGRITATAAACAVIVGATAGSVHLLRSKPDSGSNKCVEPNYSSDSNSYAVSSVETATLEQVNAPYMNGAESYEQVYKLIEKSNKKLKREQARNFGIKSNSAIFLEETADTSTAESAYDDSYTEDSGEYINYGDNIYADNEYIQETEPVDDEQTESGGKDYSDTYNQEENVLEADIVKTDGEKIYYLTNKWITGGFNDDGIYVNYAGNSYNIPVINIASVDNGIFTDSVQLDVTPETYLDDGWKQDIFVNDMYLYNDMIAVIGTVHSYCETYDEEEEYYKWEDDSKCFVSFYNKNAEFIGTYWQDGYYKDVRIAPDGYMYLVSTYNSVSFEDIGSCDNTARYIPECGTDDSLYCLPPEDILLPEKELDNGYNLSYTIIGSIDLTVSSQFTPTDTKALAGYTGDLYTSADNIYTTVGWEDTDITRISVSGGNIVPVASGTVEGYVKDQFSMSEYDGYFRIATTINKWEDNGNFFTDMIGISTESTHIQDNRVYILDMDLNQVGCVSGFGENETIKSVNFSGNMGYVVTYEQTDPLFAIDLSNPAEPFITDEFKILGYSTYMQNWTDGLLLGFGIDADENGVQTGIKLVMFDNSDLYNLQEVGLFSVNNTDNSYVGSIGTWNRKSLLIAPEKNLIGIPLTIWNDDAISDTSEYMFFEYTDGGFVQKGEIAKIISYDDKYDDSDSSYYDRALYIGDYVYVVSAGGFVSADIDTVTITDEVDF
ncbi:MAG: beta-propeller domain-containing protein [Ruminococcus flavefaciens]|nr:beta-propeller domain-containing protein [Ruminococcus flavefaciens]MCM1229545.1 beta-propeller domain-containing protein [Ruminococcus flavefaciens]